MADFDFEEDPYFDEEDDFEFDPRDDWGYNLYDNYDVANINRQDVPFKSEYEVYAIDKVDAFYKSQKKNDFGMLTYLHDINRLALDFYLDPKTDQLFAKIERNPDGKDVVRLTETKF